MNRLRAAVMFEQQVDERKRSDHNTIAIFHLKIFFFFFRLGDKTVRSLLLGVEALPVHTLIA